MNAIYALLIVFTLSFPAHVEAGAESSAESSAESGAGSGSAAEDIFDLSKYKGKVVYLDFWASWCVPCRKSFPWLNKMREKYTPEQLVIVAVNLDKEQTLAMAFLEKYPASFDITFDPKGVTAKKYEIPGMPSSILFDHNGKVIDAHSGFFTKKVVQYEAQLETAVSQLSAL
jgi:thiol-disulfide isomerase/thioredoxin